MRMCVLIHGGIQCMCVCYMTIWLSGYLYIGVHSCMITVCACDECMCAMSALSVLVSLPTILIF